MKCIENALTTLESVCNINVDERQASAAMVIPQISNVSVGGRCEVSANVSRPTAYSGQKSRRLSKYRQIGSTVAIAILSAAEPCPGSVHVRIAASYTTASRT